MRLRWVLIAMLVLAGGACDAADPVNDAPVPASEGEASASGTTSASPGASSSGMLEERAARLEGTYDVKLFVTANSYKSKPDPRQTWKFSPKCPDGACDTIATGIVHFQGKGASDRRQAGATGRFDVRLFQVRARYTGSVTDFLGSCGKKPKKDTWTFALRVDRAAEVDGAWTVTKWSGTWERLASFDPVCGAAKLKAVVRGSLA